MDRGVRNTLTWVLGFIALILGLLMATVLLREPSPEQLRDLGYFGYEQPRALESFEMADDLGLPVGRDDLTGKWSLLFFGFTFCPDICPTTLSVLNEAMNEMNTIPEVVLVTVDPERDTPQVLQRYVKSFNPMFRGFAGTFDETVNLATQVNVAFGKVPGPEVGTYTMDHSASIVVINPDGEYVGFIKAPHQARKIATIMNAIAP